MLKMLVESYYVIKSLEEPKYRFLSISKYTSWFKLENYLVTSKFAVIQNPIKICNLTMIDCSPSG